MKKNQAQDREMKQNMIIQEGKEVKFESSLPLSLGPNLYQVPHSSFQIDTVRSDLITHLVSLTPPMSPL